MSIQQIPQHSAAGVFQSRDGQEGPSRPDAPASHSDFAGTAWLPEQALMHGKQFKILELNVFLANF